MEKKTHIQRERDREGFINIKCSCICTAIYWDAYKDGWKDIHSEERNVERNIYMVIQMAHTELSFFSLCLEMYVQWGVFPYKTTIRIIAKSFWYPLFMLMLAHIASTATAAGTGTEVLVLLLPLLLVVWHCWCYTIAVAGTSIITVDAVAIAADMNSQFICMTRMMVIMFAQIQTQIDTKHEKW